MTQPLADTWDWRDLPVLRAIVQELDSTMEPVMLPTIGALTGLDGDDVKRAVLALDRAGLITASWTEAGGGEKFVHFVRDVGATAFSLVGAWPSPDTGVDRMIAALEAIARNSPTEDERTRAQKILDLFVGAGRDIAVSVATTMITGQMS